MCKQNLDEKNPDEYIQTFLDEFRHFSTKFWQNVVFDEMSFRGDRFRRNVMDPITRNLSSEKEKSGFLASRSMYTLLEVLLNILQNGEKQRGE